MSQIASSPDLVPVPADPVTLYAIVGSLVGRAVEFPVTQLFRYLNRLPEEFQVLFASFASSKASTICSTQAFADWTIEHQQALGLRS